MVETDITKRWEEGISHHPKSIELFELLEAVDYHLCDDCFYWKSGGDGDNGETFMYELDIIFEAQDAGIDVKNLIAKTIEERRKNEESRDT